MLARAQDGTLLVARLLAPQLDRAGATVLFTKKDLKPVTDATPEQFRDIVLRTNTDGSTVKISVISAEYKKFLGEAIIINGIETEAVEAAVDDYLMCRL